jgi:hypothetical protein
MSAPDLTWVNMEQTPEDKAGLETGTDPKRYEIWWDKRNGTTFSVYGFKTNDWSLLATKASVDEAKTFCAEHSKKLRKPRKSKPESPNPHRGSSLDSFLQEVEAEIATRRTRAKELYAWLGWAAGQDKLVGLPCIDQETGEEEYMVAVKAEGDRMWPIALMFMDGLKAVERYKPVK